MSSHDGVNKALGASLSIRAKTERAEESCWQTPSHIVAAVAGVMGGIDLDPCTTLENPVGAVRFYTPANDGILQSWDAARIFVNPPYGATIRHWTGKAIDAASRGSKVVLLVPARTDTHWFQELLRAGSSVLFVKGRIKFLGAKWSAPFPSALVGLNVDLRRCDIPGECFVRVKIEAAS